MNSDKLNCRRERFEGELGLADCNGIFTVNKLTPSCVLSQMEKNAAAGRTFGSIPIATPPPVSSPTVSHSKTTAPFQLRARGQALGMETSCSHALGVFEDGTGSTFGGLDAKSTESAETLPLKSSAGHNVMVTTQGEMDAKILNLVIFDIGRTILPFPG